MKLLFLIKTLALPGGGAERVLADVAAGLAERGHEVIVASFDREGADDFYGFDWRIERVRLGIGHAHLRSDLGTTLARIRRLRRFVTERRPDVAVGFMHSAYIPLALALAGSRLPVVASEHIVFEHYGDRPIERALLRLVLPFLHSITAISESMRHGFPQAIRRKMAVVPNPVRAPSSAVGRVHSPGNIILAVGRLEQQKDHRTLVAAFARVAALFPGWRLRIVGEGVLRPCLETQIAALGLERRVELPGAVAKIEAEYRAASIVAVPSLYESFGIATAEAMAHGVPVIGFADCPGTNELIVDGVNGLLVDLEDRVAGLADGLARLMGSQEERNRLGSAGPERAAMFAPEKIVNRWEELLSEARKMRAVP